MNPNLDKLKNFMLESNRIEGEDRLNPADLQVATSAIEVGFPILEIIFEAHRVLTNHLKVDWSGKLREEGVRVGSWIAPRPSQLMGMMSQFVGDLADLNSWEAHNRFEKIHPFIDFNGRVGRLIWLSKAVREGYNFSIPFLQEYYYQTLQNTEKEKEFKGRFKE